MDMIFLSRNLFKTMSIAPPRPSSLTSRFRRVPMVVWLRENLDLARLRRVVLSLGPLLVWYLASGDTAWLDAGFMGLWLLLAAEQLRPSLPMAMVTAAITAALIHLLCLAYPLPWLFAALCALAGALAALMGRRGPASRAIGNHVFLPALYLGCQLGARADVAVAYAHLLPRYALVVALVVLVQYGKACLQSGGVASVRTFCRLPALPASDPVDAATARAARDAAVLRLAAVLLTTAAARYFDLKHGEWMIWVAGSVVVGTHMPSRRIAGDIATGALLGTVVGSALSLLALHLAPLLSQHSRSLAAFASLGVAVGFGACVRIRIAYAMSCMACSVLAVVGSGMYGAGLLRLEYLLAGAAAGVVLVLMRQAIGGLRWTGKGKF